VDEFHAALAAELDASLARKGPAAVGPGAEPEDGPGEIDIDSESDEDATQRRTIDKQAMRAYRARLAAQLAKVVEEHPPRPRRDTFEQWRRANGISLASFAVLNHGAIGLEIKELKQCFGDLPTIPIGLKTEFVINSFERDVDLFGRNREGVQIVDLDVENEAMERMKERERRRQKKRKSAPVREGLYLYSSLLRSLTLVIFHLSAGGRAGRGGRRGLGAPKGPKAPQSDRVSTHCKREPLSYASQKASRGARADWFERAAPTTQPRFSLEQRVLKSRHRCTQEMETRSLYSVYWKHSILLCLFWS
jgi:hypothetical protein